MAYGAIDILHPAAADADGVVVIVAHPRLVQCGGVGRLEASQHLQVREVAQHHINRLRCQFGKILARGRQDAFGRGMWIVLNGSEDRQTLFGHAASVGMQGGSPRFLVC